MNLYAVLRDVYFEMFYSLGGHFVFGVMARELNGCDLVVWHSEDRRWKP